MNAQRGRGGALRREAGREGPTGPPVPAGGLSAERGDALHPSVSAVRGQPLPSTLNTGRRCWGGGAQGTCGENKGEEHKGSVVVVVAHTRAEVTLLAGFELDLRPLGPSGIPSRAAGF